MDRFQIAYEEADKAKAAFVNGPSSAQDHARLAIAEALIDIAESLREIDKRYKHAEGG
jgi:hypothetical protein